MRFPKTNGCWFGVFAVTLVWVCTAHAQTLAKSVPPSGTIISFNRPRVAHVAPGIHAIGKLQSKRKQARKGKNLAGQRTPIGSASSNKAPRSLQANLVGAQFVGCASSSTLPAPIVALVSALKCDPDLIYEYVYNNIEFEPLYGSHKGALGTLIDRQGGDADQAILLVTMLNAAGYTQTGYYNALVTYTGAQIANLLGVPNDTTAILQVLSAGGFAIASATPTTGSGPLTSIEILHYFAALKISGTWNFFDPSSKSHTMVSGVANLATVLGYSRSQFLTDAGGTSNSYSVSNLNRANLRSDLTSYATNLVNYINQNNRAWSVANITGGKLIQLGSPTPGTIPGRHPRVISEILPQSDQSP